MSTKKSSDSEFELEFEAATQTVDYLPARMLNEFVYCPRLFYLEHVEGLFANNADTVEGSQRHKRVDQEKGSLPDANNSTSETIHARSITLSCEEFGIIAKLDLVEATGDVATPIDYKRGSPKKMPDGSIAAWEPEEIQVCAQALVLRENGYRCYVGIIYFCETKQRVEVPFTGELVQKTREAIANAKWTAAQPMSPPPLDSSPKCPRCSLVGICLPDETMVCRKFDDNNRPLEQPLLFNIGVVWTGHRGETIAPDATPRTLIATRDEKKPLYLNTPGLYVGKSGEVLQIKEKDTIVEKVRLHDVSQVNLLGNVQVTTQAVQTLLQMEIPLIYFSMGGWFYGMTQSVGLKNIIWRREQFRMADSANFCLRFSKEIVAAKIRNQRTLLMRNHSQPPADALRFLKAIGSETERANSLEQLLGIEGVAARTYFENFSGMIKVGQADDPDRAPWDPVEDCLPPWLNFSFKKRNRRPPRDPVNALLSLGYSLLAKDVTVACAAVGLDPFLGFYHQPRFGRPALALDLMEPFRPLIVDSAVLSAINTRMIQPDHFRAAADAVALTPEGRKNFFRAYEQRMDQLVTHPLFGYRVSYRRILEIQSRLLARVLTGEIKNYPTFETR
ncbi:MAG: CRISPR-associated endonuclease Cas1 [Pirellulaceae bacterium]